MQSEVGGGGGDCGWQAHSRQQPSEVVRSLPSSSSFVLLWLWLCPRPPHHLPVHHALCFQGSHLHSVERLHPTLRLRALVTGTTQSKPTFVVLEIKLSCQLSLKWSSEKKVYDGGGGFSTRKSSTQHVCGYYPTCIQSCICCSACSPSHLSLCYRMTCMKRCNILILDWQMHRI